MMQSSDYWQSQQPFGGKGSQQQSFGGNASQQSFGGKGCAQQQFGGNGSQQSFGGKGCAQQQFGGNASQQSFGGKGMAQQQFGGCGATHQSGGKGMVQQQPAGKGVNLHSPGVYCVECNAFNTDSTNCWQCKSPLYAQPTYGKGFGKGSPAANQWATSAAQHQAPINQPPNYGGAQQQAPIYQPPNNGGAQQQAPIYQPPAYAGAQQQVTNPQPYDYGAQQHKWCPTCGNQCVSRHAYCGMCYHQFFAKGAGKGGGSGNYNYGKGGGTGYSGNTMGGGAGAVNHGGGAAPDYNLGGDRFTTEMKSFPARIPRCFEVAFEMGNFTYSQSAPLEVQWRECSEYLSASKAMMGKINNFQAFLNNKENQITTLSLGAWQRRSFLMETMRSVPQGAVNAHKVDVQQIHKLLGNLVPDNNSALKQSLQDVMLQLASVATPTEPVEAVDQSFEDQARDFLDDYEANGMDYDEPVDIPQFYPDGDELGPDLPEDFFDTPPLPKCRRLREKQPLPRGTAINRSVEAAEIAIHSSDSDVVNIGDVTPGLSKNEKKEAKKVRRAQALAASSKSVIKSGGKR